MYYYMLAMKSIQLLLLLLLQVLTTDMMASMQFATPRVAAIHGLPLTTALWSPSNELRFSTDVDAVGSGLEMLKSASQTRLQPLTHRSFLVAPTLAILLDLPLLGSTLSSQVKSNNL